jgi:DNA-binding NarL/FixJ family response regulator
MRVSLPGHIVSMAAEKRRVLIVDDHRFFASCLRALLENESDLTVCDIAGTSRDLGSRIEKLRPDLLVIDLSLGTESGLELGRRLRELHIATPILFISTVGQPTRSQLAGVGHSAFIAKSRHPAEFLAALRAILALSDSPRPPDIPFAFTRQVGHA